jgi:site-specific DNA-methyltransferase (adenine-specific)
MRRLPSQSIDCIVTSPPYNLRNSTGGGIRSPGRKWRNPALRNGYDEHDDAMERRDYIEFQKECLWEMCRLIKPSGAIFYNHRPRVQAGLIEDPMEWLHPDFPVRQQIIWRKSGGVNSNIRFFIPTYEVIYLICGPAFRLAVPNPTRPRSVSGYTDVWEIPTDRNNGHPAPFPVEIPRRCIEATGARVVLDPFMGSGSTAIAATLQGAHYIGIEKSFKYIKEAEARIAKSRPLKPNSLAPASDSGGFGGP